MFRGCAELCKFAQLLFALTMRNLVISRGSDAKTISNRNRVVYYGLVATCGLARAMKGLSSSASAPVGERAARLLRAALDSQPPTDGKIRRVAVRIAISAGVILALLAGCLWLPNIDHATVALLMVAACAAFATFWGRVEALTSALIGGIGFDYYFLPPRGIGIEKTEHIVALMAFLFATVAIGQLAARSKELLAQRDSLLHLSPDPLCVADLNGYFRSVNQAMIELLGWSDEDLCSKPILEFVHPDDQPGTNAAFRDFSEERPVLDVENRYRTKDGSWRWLHWKVAPPSDGASWISAAARDVTSEKWAQEKLRDLAGQLMAAQEEERRRIARELHDDLTQRLATLGIELGLLKRTAGADASQLPNELSGLQAQIINLSEDVRRLSHSLHPSILEHADLATSLEMHCREFTEQYGIMTNFTVRNLPDNIPRAVTLALYRIAQESLRNVGRHSGASYASVTLAGDGETHLSLFVIDNGKGFDLAKAKSSSGLGLMSIQERARQIGASITIESMLDSGTRLGVQVPLIRE